MPSKPSESAKSISLSKCPMFLTISIVTCSKVMMLKLHVEEAKISVSDTAVSMAATWSHPCTPAGRNWVTFSTEHASTRITKSQRIQRARKEDHETSGATFVCEDLPRLLQAQLVRRVRFCRTRLATCIRSVRRNSVHAMTMNIRSDTSRHANLQIKSVSVSPAHGVAHPH